jgi:hypothetical protein
MSSNPEKAEETARKTKGSAASEGESTEGAEGRHAGERAMVSQVKSGMKKLDPKKTLGYLKKKPALGAVIAGGIGFAAASTIGVGEVAIAMAAGYAAYRALTG